MVHVAKEMQRQNFQLPLMIGGATTSKAHTAVKIDPQYSNDAVVYVTDASRAVGVATSLLSKELKADYVARTRADYAVVRRTHGQPQRPHRAAELRTGDRQQAGVRLGRLPGADAFLHRRQGARRDRPRGARRVHRLDAVLHFLGPGRQVPAHPHRRGWSARPPPRCSNDAQAMLEEADRREADQGPCGVRLLAGQPGRARRPGGSTAPMARPSPPCATCGSRRSNRTASRTCRWADFRRAEGSGVRDYIRRLHHHRWDRRRGSGQGVRSQGDDYNSIMVKALADRLAEACAEWLHERVRKSTGATPATNTSTTRP